MSKGEFSSGPSPSPEDDFGIAVSGITVGTWTVGAGSLRIGVWLRVWFGGLLLESFLDSRDDFCVAVAWGIVLGV
jgi:hypothetical protein